MITSRIRVPAGTIARIASVDLLPAHADPFLHVQAAIGIHRHGAVVGQDALLRAELGDGLLPRVAVRRGHEEGAEQRQADEDREIAELPHRGVDTGRRNRRAGRGTYRPPGWASRGL